MNLPKKALVLGGATGLLGQAIVKALRENEKEWEVHCLGRENGDLFTPPFLQVQIEDIQPDIIFNTIAYTQVDLAEDEKQQAYKVNRDFPKMIGEIIQDMNVKLVHYSTDFVFDGTKHTPYTEEDVPNPISVYGSSKLAGEEALKELKLKQCLIIRTSWLFGPGRKNFISTIIEKAQNNIPLNVIHDQLGSPTYTAGLAHNTLALLEKNATGVFHLSNSGLASWFEFANEAVHIAGYHTDVTPIMSSEYPQKAKRPAYSVLSNEKFCSLVGVSPRTWSHSLRNYLFDHLAFDYALGHDDCHD